MTTTTTTTKQVSIRRLTEDDLDLADQICRTAFGTYLGVPEPETFFGDASYVHTRTRAPNTEALAATIDDELVGSNLVTRWGSIGFFGPLSVRVDLWDSGIASRLMEATMDVFTGWQTRHAALFTWADSPKHHGLYQKFGFYPTYLTAIMAKTVRDVRVSGWTTYDQTDERHRNELLDACRYVAGQLYPDLDLSGEIRSVHEQRLGDTVIVMDGDRVDAFAVCHVGGGTEAGSGACFVKFGLARPGPNAARDFDRLVDACEGFAASRGADRIVAGVNMGRLHAYARLGSRGFRTELTGVAMQQAGEHAYNRPDSFVIDDLR